VPEEPASGRISILYGNAEGVPPQHATTFPSALGVEGIATGDFDLDGHADVVGSYWHYSASAGGVGGVFFQSGDGAGHLGAPQELPLDSGEGFNYDPVRVADLDGNGTADVVAIVGGKVQVLLNQKVLQVVSPSGPAGSPLLNGPGGKSPTGGSTSGKALGGILKVPKIVKAAADGTLLLGTATNPPTAGLTITITVPPIGKAKGSALAALAQKGADKKASKPLVVGKAHVTVPAGKTVPLKVKLSSKARGMLKRSPLHTKLTLLAISAGGAEQSETEALTIKAAARKKTTGK
jgi:hypothetical protein